MIRAGVIITPNSAILAKSLTCSMDSLIFNSSSASLTAPSNALHFAHPPPNTLIGLGVSAVSFSQEQQYFFSFFLE